MKFTDNLENVSIDDLREFLKEQNAYNETSQDILLNDYISFKDVLRVIRNINRGTYQCSKRCYLRGGFSIICN
jgi:hypothetical protein